MAASQRGFVKVPDKFVKNKGAEIKLPVKGSKYSAGYDFFCPIDVTIEPGKSHLIWTDVASYMNGEHDVLLIFVRSSIGIRRNLMLANTVGVIDKDYFMNEDNGGNIGICLHNYGKNPVDIKAGERVAQGIFVSYLDGDSTDTINANRTGGFGSTNE